MPECKDHSGFDARLTRNEQDVQTLFSKFGEAIGLMHKIDKRLEGFWAKILGITLGATTLLGVVIKLLDTGMVKRLVGP